MGELKALYFIGKKLSCQILEIESRGKKEKNNRESDFIFKDANSIIWNTEVKSPSWKSVESKKIDGKFPDLQRKQRNAKIERWGQPQYIGGISNTFSEKDALEDSIKKGVVQFKHKKGENNLLIITPNMIEGDLALELSKQFDGAPIHECLALFDTEQVISCVCILCSKLFCGEKGFQYEYIFVPSKIANRKSPKFNV